MDIVMQLVDIVLHVDKSLGLLIQQYGAWVYVLLFAIVFAETGLVVLPFLPGDTLLFIAGAMCATGQMDAWLLIVLLVIAATTGNTVNYLVGSWIGPKVFDGHIRFLDHEALMKTHGFYERHGGKTLVMARFIPVVRTFAPFVAGVSKMTFAKFQLFNMIGAVLWVAILVLSGEAFGNVPVIRDHLNTIVLIGLGAAIVPLMLGGLWKLLKRRRGAVAQK
ncbi:VTT domain-containing protein [Ralstonia pickettii]|uniref:VTT domain-containing protein n=2 Tax=Burkholderiaceae TaxID=119060 RepID=A0AAW4Q6V5_RALPI|nr:VTT domain-containing protein [Ralstonia pickettii]MBX3768451.1 VTT domain-containing protein [Ralstonia pickettii]MBX3779329.1 VTT domain-containing protein [Ralstonia pickettii]MBX3784445.1 VTT domain-containing protein [Ralstonia pickettii]MBX3789537.1 VTT domain-containing protein [Ralstonia pickettii]